MEIKKAIYKRFPFIPKFNLALGRELYSLKIKNNRTSTIKSLKDRSSIYANIGSGGAGLSEGWINIDYGQYENVHYYFDCRKDLPFSNDSVKGLFTEHFLEHLDFIEEIPKFLLDAYRVLQPGGCIRIIVPDAEKYLRAYCSEGWDLLKQTRPLDNNLYDLLMGKKYDTKMELINEVFRQGGQHKYAWDYDTMKLVLKRAGFNKISKKAYMESNDKNLEIDLEIRQYESLYVEAVK